MYVVDLNKAIQGFNVAEGHDENSYTVGKEIDKTSFEKFYRIMTSQTPEDIEDISPEDILGMFSKIGDYAPYFAEKASPVHSIAAKLSSTRTVLFRRRIL